MIQFRQYGTLALANHMVSGGILSGKKTTELFNGLIGETITFTSPAGSHTFTQPAGAPAGQMRFADIKTQLEDAISNLRVVSVDNKLGFKHATAGTAVTMGSANEPARVILGFPNNVAIAGEVINEQGGTAPSFEGISAEHGSITIAISTT